MQKYIISSQLKPGAVYVFRARQAVRYVKSYPHFSTCAVVQPVVRNAKGELLAAFSVRVAELS
jgi:hypothetical protein